MTGEGHSGLIAELSETRDRLRRIQRIALRLIDQEKHLANGTVAELVHIAVDAGADDRTIAAARRGELPA